MNDFWKKQLMISLLIEKKFIVYRQYNSTRQYHYNLNGPYILAYNCYREWLIIPNLNDSNNNDIKYVAMYTDGYKEWWVNDANDELVRINTYE